MSIFAYNSHLLDQRIFAASAHPISQRPELCSRRAHHDIRWGTTLASFPDANADEAPGLFCVSVTTFLRAVESFLYTLGPQVRSEV